jgi:hypothetical protein
MTNVTLDFQLQTMMQNKLEINLFIYVIIRLVLTQKISTNLILKEICILCNNADNT